MHVGTPRTEHPKLPSSTGWLRLRAPPFVAATDQDLSHLFSRWHFCARPSPESATRTGVRGHPLPPQAKIEWPRTKPRYHHRHRHHRHDHQQHHIMLSPPKAGHTSRANISWPGRGSDRRRHELRMMMNTHYTCDCGWAACPARQINLPIVATLVGASPQNLTSGLPDAVARAILTSLPSWVWS